MSEEWKELPTIGDVACALADGMEIEYQQAMNAHSWNPWDGFTWYHDCKYRARPRKETKLVKSLCWREAGGNLTWRNEGAEMVKCWERFPAGDIEGEVEA